MQKIGEFQLTDSVLRVTDPCYTKDTWCAGVLPNCKLGLWEAHIETSDEGSWGIRVSELYIEHNSFKFLSNAFDWLEKDIDVGVDSGQAGFFQDSKYPESMEEFEFDNDETFYAKCGNATLNTTEHAGIIDDFGVVSSSGYGDGSYVCYTKELDGVVVVAKIVFISDEIEEMSDDDWKDYVYDEYRDAEEE